MGTHIYSLYLRHLACTPQTGKVIGCIYRLFRLFAARHWTMCRAQQFQRQIHFWAGTMPTSFWLLSLKVSFPPNWQKREKPSTSERLESNPKNRISSQKLDDSLAKNHPKQGFVWKYDTHPIDTPKNCCWPLIIILLPIGSMVLLYMMTWIPSIYPIFVSIYTSTMDPSWAIKTSRELGIGPARLPQPWSRSQQRDH